MAEGVFEEKGRVNGIRYHDSEYGMAKHCFLSGRTCSSLYLLGIFV